MGVVEEEADETALWIELLIERGLLPPSQLRPLWKEADELTRIAVASIRTTRASTIRNPKSAVRNRETRDLNKKTNERTPNAQ